MSRNGSTWPGTLPTLRKIFRIHPSFGGFKRFLRRRERRPAHSPPPLATPEGDRNSSRRPSSAFSRRTVRNDGGPSTDTNNFGFGYLYDINKPLSFLDVATANADMAVSADECNAYQNYASTSSAPSPLSALSGGFFVGPDLKDLPSSTSVGFPEMDVAFQHSLLCPGVLLFTADPTASTSQAGPSTHSLLSDLQPPNAPGLQFADYSEEVDPRLIGPRMNCVPLPPLSPSLELPPTPFAHADESTNEQYNYETLYQTPFAANHDEPATEHYQDTTHRSYTAPESLPLQRGHQLEMVPDTLATAPRIIDYFKPTKLVIDRQISLIDMQSVLFALRHCLQDLTIGPIGIGQPKWPSATATINISHLTSLKVDRVDFSFLKELLAPVRMDNLRTLDLRVESLESMPDQLNIRWSQLTALTLHDDFSLEVPLEVLNKVMGSLRDVTRLKWSGKLARENHQKYSYNLKSLEDLSVCSNEDGCAFFLGNIHSLAKTLQTLHLSHFSLGHLRDDLLQVKNLFIEDKIGANEFLAILNHFPALLSADFRIGSTTVAEKSGRFTMQQRFARLNSLILRNVSAPIRPLLMPIPLSELTSLEMTFDSKAGNKHEYCLGLADCLQNEDSVPLNTLRLVDANLKMTGNFKPTVAPNYFLIWSATSTSTISVSSVHDIM